MKKRQPFENEIKFNDLFKNEFLTIGTQNSVYLIRVVAHNEFIVRGGWFDRKGLSPYRIGIEGATWGLGDIFSDIAAALGMRIKFKNGFTTSPIKSIERLKSMAWNLLGR